jgi:lysophospholipase L1-like esterase
VVYNRGMSRLRTAPALAIVAAIAVGVGGVLAETAVRLFYHQMAFESAVWVNHRVLGYTYRPNHRYVYRTVDDSGAVAATTDADGLVIRASLDRANADRAILFIGDSMLDGQGVGVDENLSEVVARRLAAAGQACRCANVGMSASSPARYLLSYRTYRARVRPDTVVVFVYALNDFNDDARLFHDDRLVIEANGDLTRIRPLYDCRRGTEWRLDAGIQPMPRRQSLRDCGGLQTYQLAVRTWSAVGGERGPRSGIARFSDFASRAATPIRDNVLAIFRREDELTGTDRADVARTLGWLHRLVTEATADGASPLIVVVPFAGQLPGALGSARERYGHIPEGTMVADTPQRLLRSWLVAHDIAFVDLLPVLRSGGAARFFGPRDKHFSAEGHQVVGTAIADYIVARLTHTSDARAQRRSRSE